MLLRRAFAKASTSDTSSLSPYFINANKHYYSQKLDLSSFDDQAIVHDFTRPPTIKHNLHRILQTQGIYKTEEFNKVNGNEFLTDIGKYDREALKRMPQYTPPSKDPILLEEANRQNVKYLTGSSSITEAMMQIYFMISNFRSPDVTGLGKNYDHKNLGYMSAYRKPTTFMIRRVTPTSYAIDGDKGFLPKQNLDLMECGVLLEAMLTSEQKTFENLMDLNYELSTQDIEDLMTGSRSHRMRKMNNMLVRSQIDCEAVSDDGSYYVYEIKTRAVAPQRYDVENVKDYLDYEIMKRSGVHSSYEREYFDLIRSILIKYYFQISIGHMDGAMVAYHNTQKMFGFEYIGMKEMEKRIFGNEYFGYEILKATNSILQLILDKVTDMFPEDDQLRIGLYSNMGRDNLHITIERFDESFGWFEGDDDVPYTDEMDWYLVNSPNKRAYALQLDCHPVLNGILQKDPLFLEPGDNLEILYKMTHTGVMEFGEYMAFLHNAFKQDLVTLNKDFIGTWRKANDFHTYRKPIVV